MSKSLYCLLFCINLSFIGFSQHSLKGKVLDDSGNTLSHATVALLNPSDSTLQFFGVTNAKGEYHIRNVKSGNYLMQYSYVGMQTEYLIMDVPSSKGEDLGIMVLKPTMMEEVIVEAELIPVKFKTDTLEYDVRAFKTRPGAAVEELLQKLPGIEVDESGNIKAEGEEVTKVLVDGKEFFDKDPKVATKNLPAKALKKVQVIDRKSEEALFTGIDDGTRDKTINLELKEDHKKGYFGDLSAGLGTEDYYKLEGKVYRFSKKTQNALMGMANNLNEFGFTHKGNNQFGQNTKGINTTLGGGINLSYNPSSMNRYFVNYLGSSIQKDLEEEVNTTNFFDAGTYEQVQNLTVLEKDRPHKFNYGARHNFNKKNRLILDGDFIIGTNNLQSQDISNSQLEKARVNQFENSTQSKTSETSINTRATYITKIKGDKTQLKLNGNLTYNENSADLDWSNSTTLFDPLSNANVEQFRNSQTDRLRMRATPSLIQQLGENWTLTLGAGLGREEANFKRAEGVLNTLEEFDEIPIPDFSLDQRYIRPSIKLNKMANKTQINLSMDAMVNSFDKILDASSIDKPQYFYWLPGFSFRNEYRTGRRINGRYSTNIVMPSIQQLNPVIDSINQLTIIQGNLNLEPEYHHNLAMTWSMFDQFSFTSVIVRVSGNYTSNKIRWSQEISEDLVRINSPVNVKNNSQLVSYIYFATPLRSLGINLNITSREVWSRGIVFINGVQNINTNFTHMLNLGIENRNNDQFAINLSASINLTDSRFSVAEDQNNVYFNTNFTGNLRYTPNKKWNFQARANVLNYNAQSFDQAVSVPLLTSSISYFFLQAEKASITLSGFDLLNKYIGFQRIGETNFLMQRRWNTIGRYAMLTFRIQMR